MFYTRNYKLLHLASVVFYVELNKKQKKSPWASSMVYLLPSMAATLMVRGLNPSPEFFLQEFLSVFSFQGYSRGYFDISDLNGDLTSMLMRKILIALTA